MESAAITEDDVWNYRVWSDLHSESGEKIFHSRYFEEARTQRHHKRTTVAAHTMGVAATSLKLYYLCRALHINVNKEDLIRASLCHDLGIVGRDRKFSDNIECCHQHPIDSVAAAKEIFPDLDERTEDAIRHHMWPCTLVPPHHIEGVIVTIADKYCAMAEGIAGNNHCPGHRFLQYS